MSKEGMDLDNPVIKLCVESLSCFYQIGYTQTSQQTLVP